MNKQKTTKINWSRALSIFIPAYLVSKILLYFIRVYLPDYSEIASSEWIAPIFVAICSVIFDKIYVKMRTK